MRSLRLLDKSGQLVRVLEDGEAETLVATGKAEFRKTGRREVVVLLDQRTVRDFQRGSDDGTLGGQALQSTYCETHAGHTIAMIKRASESVTIEGETEKQLHRWDPHLTFDEIRAGQLVSQATRQRREDAEWRREHIIAFLAYEEFQRSAA